MNLAVALTIIAAIMLTINIILFNDLAKKENIIKAFIDSVEEYVKAFNTVKMVVNENDRIATQQREILEKHSEMLGRVNNMLEVHSYALRLTPPDMFSVKLAENGQDTSSTSA